MIFLKRCSKYISFLFDEKSKKCYNYIIINCIIGIVHYITINQSTIFNLLGSEDMKKIWKFKIGGLQQKIINLVIVAILAVLALFGAVSIYQGRQLKKIVEDASSEQQEKINTISQSTMEQVVNKTLKKSTSEQAYIANDMFSDAVKDVKTLQSFASGLFNNNTSFTKRDVPLPDRSKNGTVCPQLLHEGSVDPKDSENIGLIGNMSDVMMSLYSNSKMLNSCFVALSDGTCLMVDDRPADKFDGSGDPINVQIRQRSWYTGAVSKGDIYFTDIEKDSFTGKIGIVCSAPVYKNGELVAVVGIDLFLDTMAQYVESSIEDGGYICVVNEKGHVIFSPKSEGTFKAGIADKTQDIRNTGNKELADFVNSSYKDKTDLKTITVDGKELYMSAAPIKAVGWSIISVVEKQITKQPAQMMVDEFDKINKNAQDVFNDAAKKSETTTLVMIILIFLLGSGTALYVANRIVKPVEHMTKRISEISGDDLEFKMEKIYKTKDEIEILAQAFETLSARTRKYIDTITDITKEKERIKTELELATKIQADMLPNLFPAFPDRPEFDIYATMNPAKEVGGDFYDFFLIDNDHLALVMADVSGKGFPAALFMMMSKILVNNFASLFNSPAKILEMTNKTICMNNDEGMFVTLWLGILEISTGKIIASNAGHEYPVVKRKNGKFTLQKDKHGFVIGGFENQKYTEYEIKLEKGDMIFLYTDGVVEATNSNNELFGTERMLKALNEHYDPSPQQLLTGIKRSVDEFVGDASQFDDLTMLGLKIQ